MHDAAGASSVGEATRSNGQALRYAAHADLAAFVERLLVNHGVSDTDARTAAACLVRADLRGIDTHGTMRLPGYLDRIRRGLVNPRPDPKLEFATPTVALIDGQDGLGPVVATRAMTAAIEIADRHGAGVIAVRRSTHFGMAANYVLQAVDAGFISIVLTNASPTMSPWGGREALLGTSPIAAGAPSGREVPLVLDMSVSVAARGKITKALRRGESIPLGYALDAEGRATTEPAEALKGVVLPIGGPKGSGLAIFIDIIAGVITGAGFGGGVGDQYKTYDRPQNVGHFFLALKPDLFLSRQDYAERMDQLVRRIHGAPRAEGFDEILMPGEREARLEKDRLRRGIPFAALELDQLNEEARRFAIPSLKSADAPFQ